MASHQLVTSSILAILVALMVHQVATANGNNFFRKPTLAGDSEYRYGPSSREEQRVDALFDTFSEASTDSLRQFKRQFDKSFERQSQLFQFDGTDKPDSNNGMLLFFYFFYFIFNYSFL